MNNHTHMKPDEFESFLAHFGLTNNDAAEVFEVTEPAIRHWLSGRRHIQPLVAKLVRTILRKPELLKLL
jgi:DNA-binding transcriptional regulator YiaG